MRTLNKQNTKQACPHRPACLFFVCICLGIYFLFLWQSAKYVSSLRRPTWRVTAGQWTPAPSPTPAPTEGKININTATAKDLQALPGIGPVLSQSIIDAREEMEIFYYPEELLFVSGIGEKRLAAIYDLIVCPVFTAIPEN